MLLRCGLTTPLCPLHYVVIAFCITCRKPNQETWSFSLVAAAFWYWNHPRAGKCFQWCREHSTPCGRQTFLYKTICFLLTDTFLVARLAGGHSHPSAPHLLPVRLSLSRGSAWKAFWITVGSPSFPSTSNTTGHFSPYQHVSENAKDFFLAFRPSNHNSGLTDSRWTVFSFADLLHIMNFALNKVLGNTAMSLHICHIIITVWKKHLTLNKIHG